MESTHNTNLEILLKRVSIFLESEEWKKADEYCEKILDIDPENAEAYLGKLLSELKIKNKELLRSCNKNIETNKNYLLAITYSDELLGEFLIECGKIAKKQFEEHNKKKKKRTITIITLSITLLLSPFIFWGIWELGEEIQDKIYYRQQMEENESQYNIGVELFGKQEFAEALLIFNSLGNYRNSSDYFDIALKNVNIYHSQIIKQELTSNGSIRNEFVYTYDKNGNCIKEVSGNYNNSGNYIMEYTYNDSGLCIKEKHYDTSNINNSPTRYIEYTYDEDDKCITKIETVGNDTPRIYTYNYNEKGLCTEEIQGNSITTYSYDERGNCIEIDYYGRNIQQAFDYRNNVTMKITKYSNQLSPQRDYWDYTYDDNGNIIKKIHTTSSGKKYEYTYYYDNLGICYTIDCLNPSGSISTTKYIYNGRKIVNK